MKILRISIHNIASLANTQTVDFTQEPLRSAGLFSISGPTGAGKSSVLDALCLALYDATPRLRMIGRTAELAGGERQHDPRSLLRRGAGDGFAEVAFVGIDNQTYTSRWSVRRSHRRPDGAFQNVEMVLYHGHIPPGGNGPVTAGGRKTAVLQAIEEKIGLTFEQFTRAVLLAQNEFAALLRAEDRERAEILQALTGTEHFEAISRSVYARSVSERQLVDSLQMRLDGSPPMSDAARGEAELRSQQATELHGQLQQQMQGLEQHREWFRQYDSLLQKQNNAENAWRQARARSDAAADRYRQLNWTETASREARPLQSTESHAGSTLERARRQHELALRAYEEHSAAAKEASDLNAAAVVALQQAQQETKAIHPELIRARQMDSQLQPLEERCLQAQQAVDQAKREADRYAERQQQLSQQVESLTSKMQQVTADLDRLAEYQPFVVDASAWLDRMDDAIDSAATVQKTQQTLGQLNCQLRRQQEVLEQELAKAAGLQAEVDSAVTALEQSTSEEKRYDFDLLEARRSLLEARREVLNDVANYLQEMRQRTQQSNSLKSELEQLQRQQTADLHQRDAVRDQQLPTAMHAVTIAEGQLEAIQAALDDHAQRLRSTLLDGCPCPVCGATSHPFSQHEPDRESTAVRAAQQSVSELRRQRDQLVQQLAALDVAVDSRSRQIKVKEGEFQTAEQWIEKAQFPEPVDPDIQAISALPADEALSVLGDMRRQMTQDLHTITEEAAKYREAARQSEVCRHHLDELKTQLQVVQQHTAVLRQECGITKERQRNTEQQQRHAAERSAAARERLRPVWDSILTSEDSFNSDPASLRRTLEHSFVECSQLQRRFIEVSADRLTSQTQLTTLQDPLRKVQETLTSCENQLREVTEQRGRLWNQRGLVLQGRAADLVEREASELLQSRRQQAEQLAELKNAAEQQQIRADTELKSAAIACTNAEAALGAANAAIANWLAEFNHQIGQQLTRDELDQLLARDDQWIASERAEMEHLQRNVDTANGARQVHAAQLLAHDARRPTALEEADLLSQISVLLEQLQQAQLEADAARAILLSDDRCRTASHELTLQLQEQQRIAAPWLQLNELIGSADGAKFRMIAQRTTLDLLLQYANHQLNQLSPRYALERIPESLNLTVIDRDMGDERRSVHSLSGGESFLVSLALALGLASLTSNRVRIESLFIDEGFGSLDPETLNTAMNALMQLEAQGRRVGVISHVTEMTDAIPVQIKVVRGRGGASSIVVPACGFRPPPELITELTATINDGTITDRASRRQQTAGGTGTSTLADEIAAQILRILQRERNLGRLKISSRALRTELCCEPAILRAALSLLGTRVISEGRSLRLTDF